MDALIGRWMKNGLSRKVPSPVVRNRVLRAAYSWAGAMERHSALVYLRWLATTRQARFNAWDVGIAHQAALEWFPTEMVHIRLVG